MRAIGIILAGGNNNRMRELSNKRAIAAMPIAGSYRSIDFALSNMASSHIQRVAVLTQYNARSLNEHLSSSKWWDFGRKHGGLFVFSPTVTSDNSWWYRGTADAISQNLTWLKNSHEPYVVIASGDGVYKLDFNKVLEYHIAKRADVTVVCTDSKEADTSRFGVLKMNEDCRIEEFEEKPMVSSSNKELIRKDTGSDIDADSRLDAGREKGQAEIKSGEKIRIVFSENSAFEPVIANLILTFGEPVNILKADTKNVGGVAKGEMILEFMEGSTRTEMMKQYLKEKGLAIGEVTEYVGS